MAVVIPIVTEYVGKGVERAIKEFRQIEGVGNKAAFVFTRAVVPGAVAAGGALAALGVTLFKAAGAAAEAQKEDKLLADQLRRTTGATEDAITQTMNFVDALELESTISGGELSSNLALLTRSTQDVTKAQELLKIATDVSVGSGKDLSSVSEALRKAYGGEFAALEKLGIQIPDNVKKTKDYEAVQALLNKQFGGAAADAADTFQGQLAKLQISFGKIVEEVGVLVLPYLQRFVTYVNDHIMPALKVFIEALKGGNGVAGSFEIAVASMGDFAPAAIKAMRAATEAVFEFIKAIALSYAGIQTLIGAAQALASRGKAGLPAFASALAAAGGAVITDKLKSDTLNYFDGLLGRLDVLGPKAAAIKNKINPVADALDRLESKLRPKVEGLDDDPPAGKGLDKIAEKAKKLAEKTKEAASALEKEMAEALKGAEENLATAQEAFDSFAGSVGEVIRETLNFADAFKASAEEGGSSFFTELQKQADKAKEFGVLTEKLLAAGISKEALDQVLSAGVESGTEIAKQLLGAADGVLKANTLVAEVEAIADRIGLAAANKFYKAGVDNGTAYLKGVEEAIAAANARIAGAKRPADIKGAGALFAETAGALGTKAGVVNNYTITAQSLDPKRSGDVVLDALKELNRRSGPLDIKIA
jgi:hypothetical protein